MSNFEMKECKSDISFDVKEELEERNSDSKAGMNGQEFGGNGKENAPIIDKKKYEEMCAMVNMIAYPLAGRKLAKKIYKLVKLASKEKGYLLLGLSDVQKAMRRDQNGIVVIAGDVTPIDIYSHIPVWCEEINFTYIFTPSRENLGLAAGHRRAIVLLLIKRHTSYSERYDEVESAVKCMPPFDDNM